ncbi:hypothetical protein [Yinghuangia seranimata]|uniref:hypothetical protein n=1 Tax=Yinghuangia seranimata TaxID=408067 RepID=UPI00248AD822|nr:hypothetical protein [Yinghuangia seranimata]MDI2130628.1 hypothetical protein [Yinghuangia seranimata]
MTTLSFVEQTRRARRAGFWRNAPALIGLPLAVSLLGLFGEHVWQNVFGLLLGSWITRKWLHQGWWRAFAKPFGVRVLAVVRGTGRPAVVRIKGDRLLVAGKIGIGSAFDIAPRTESTRRVRVWLGVALELLVFAGVAVAAAFAVPDGKGVGLAVGAVLGATQVFSPYGVSSTPGWFLFAMPFARRDAFVLLARSTAEVRVRNLLATGELEAAERALGELDPGTAAARVFETELLVHQGRYEEAAELAFALFPGMPAGPDRAQIAQQFVRAACYIREAPRDGTGVVPGAYRWGPNEVDFAASVGLTLQPMYPTSDATALYLLVRGDFAGAAREGDRTAFYARSKPIAAHGLCTAAIAYSLLRRREPALRALRDARELGEGMPRVALAQAYVDAAFGAGAEAAAYPQMGPPAADRPDSSLTADEYQARHGTDEDAWKW